MTRHEEIIRRPASPTGIEAVWYDDGSFDHWLLVDISGPGFSAVRRRINPNCVVEMMADKNLNIKVIRLGNLWPASGPHASGETEKP